MTWHAVSPVSEVVECDRDLQAFARSRNWNFWIFPVDVLGISSKRMSLGTLYAANRVLQWAISSSALAMLAGFSSTKATGVSPHLASGLATTAHA